MCLEQRITNVMIPSGFWDHRPAHNSTAVLLGTHTNIIYMLVAGHWRADHQPHYLSVVFARQRRSGDKRQTKRKTKTPNPLVLDRALSRCFVCWLVCLLVSCVFVCLSVCVSVCSFPCFLVCLCVAVCFLACLLGWFVCEREKEESRKRLLKLNVSQHPIFLFCLCFSLRVALFDSIAGLRKQKCKNDCCKK